MFKKALLTILFVLLLISLCFGEVLKIKIDDLDRSGTISLYDKYQICHENAFLDIGEFLQPDIDKIINSQFDRNGDKKIQTAEYKEATEFFLSSVVILSFTQPIKLTIDAKFIDDNFNSYIEAGEKFTFSYSNGAKQVGIVKDTLLKRVATKGYDKDGKITAKELKDYLDSCKTYNWTIEIIPKVVDVPKDTYSLVTDTNENSIVDIGERYIHYKYSKTEPMKLLESEEGHILQVHLDMVLGGGFDVNNDGKVQKEEYEAAYQAYTLKTCKLVFVPAIINTKDYWPTNLGDIWEFTNWMFPERLSWIHNVTGHKDTNNLDAYFSKNHKDTYWGNGAEMFYRMGLNWKLDINDSLDEPHLAASSTKSYTDYFDNTPDAIVYWALSAIDTKKRFADYWNVKTQSCKGNIPYQVFPVKLDVDNFEIDSIQGQFFHNYLWPEGVKLPTKQPDHPWKIRYRWFYIKTNFGYEGPALRLSCDELYAVPSIYEDWYYVKDIGVVRLEQYSSSSRNNLLVQVNASDIFINSVK